MHKLKLEALQVESFETTRMGHHAQGTVHGNGIATQPNTLGAACGPNSLVAACAPSVASPCRPSYELACPPSVMICPQTDPCTHGCSNTTGCDVSYADGPTPQFSCLTP